MVLLSRARCRWSKWCPFVPTPLTPASLKANAQYCSDGQFRRKKTVEMCVLANEQPSSMCGYS